MFFAVSEKVAKMGIADALSLVSRQTQLRSDMFVFVCEDDSVDKFFMFNDPIHESISQHIHDVAKFYEASGKYRDTPLYLILQELESDEVSLMLPIMKAIEVEKRQEDEQAKPVVNQHEAAEAGSSSQESQETELETEIVLVVEGSYVFRGEKIAGEFSEIDTRCATILKGELEKNYIITHEEKDDIPACSIEVMNSTAKIKTQMDEDGRLIINAEFSLEGDLVEMHSLEDYMNSERIPELEKAFEELIKDQIVAAVKKTQEFESDVLGIAEIFHRSNPKEYRKIKNDWDSVFADAIVKADVKVDITSSSLTFNPIKVGR